MSFLNFGRLIKSFKYAWKGFVDILKTEQNFRFHVFAAVIVLILMFVLETTVVEKSILVMAMLFVFSAEIINSVLERVIDMLRPRLHPEARAMKDIMAAFVLLFAAGSAFIGLIIFVPKIIAQFNLI